MGVPVGAGAKIATAVQGAAAAGLPFISGFVVNKFIQVFFAPDRPDGPALATYEARGEIRSEVVARRWVVGTCRVAPALVRHADAIVPDLAKEFFDDRAGTDFYKDNPNDLHRDTTEYMSLYGYFGHVLSAGEIAGIRGIWVDGVRMNIGSPTNILDDGEIAPFAPEALADRKQPFFDRYLDEIGGSFTPGRVLAQRRAILPTIAFWTFNGHGDGYQSWPLKKLRAIYALGGSPEERIDAFNSRSIDVAWVLVRLRQGNFQGTPHPWRGVPRIEYLVEGKGPAAPDGVRGYLLDGNPAKAAYWYLTEQMGVPPALIDDVWRQSVNICDDPFIIGALSNPPVATVAQIQQLGMQAYVERRAAIRALALELDLPDPGASGVPDPLLWQAPYDAWLRSRLERVVRRFTGQDFADVDATVIASIVSAWNARFTGSADQTDGSRPRYRVGGVIPSTAEPRRVLDDLAQAMAGSIEEHGGVWYIRAGSLSVRPGNVIVDEDIVDGLIAQQLEPNIEDQPDELRAGLLQNQRLEYERFAMDPVDRLEANIGEIDATNRPASVWTQTETTEGYAPRATGTGDARVYESTKPKRVHDMGEMSLVTDPLQADELMRIALYQTRWNTRTIQLTIRPGADFKFYRLSRGEPVLLNVQDEHVMGERVGERTDSMRCIVAAPPRYQPNGNIELTLRQQDEETFGEKFGLVFDYNDSGDVILIPPPPPPVEPPTCTRSTRTADPGQRFTRADGWQIVGTGGTGRLTYGLTWTDDNPGISIDSSTGFLTGRVPTVQKNTYYNGLASVTDSKGNVGKCDVRLLVRVQPIAGDRPWIEVSGLQAAQPGEITTFRAVMHFPQTLLPAFRGGSGVPPADQASWSFRLNRYTSPSIPSGARITTDGAGTWAPPSRTPVGTHTVSIIASASGMPTVSKVIDLVVAPSTTECAVTFGPVQVKRGQALLPTSIFSAINNANGALRVQVETRIGAGPMERGLPSGLTLSSTGMLSGTTNVLPGTWRPTVTVADTGPPSQTCTQTGAFRIEVQEPDTPQTCDFLPSSSSTTPIEIRRSGVRRIAVRLRGFSGTPETPDITGPSWMTIEGPVPGHAGAIAYNLVLASGRATGDYEFTVRSGRATCTGYLRVNEDPPPPLTMEDVTLRVKEGESWTGGMNAVGGSGALSYAWEGAEPTDEIGLVLDTRTGDFSGTAPAGANAPGTYGPYTVRATKGTEEIDADVTAIVAPDTTPPPPEVTCVGTTLSGSPGTTVSLSGIDRVQCVADAGGNLAADHASTSAMDSTGTAVAGWTGAWTFSGTLGDPGQPLSSGVIAEFSTTIPAGQALGDYTFENTVRSDRGGSADVTITVTVTNVPITISDLQMNIRQPTTSAFSRRLTARGGPATGSYSFVKASGPSWLDISTNGLVTFAARHQPTPAAPWSVTVTKGTGTATISGYVTIFTGGGGGPVDPDDDEELV